MAGRRLWPSFEPYKVKTGDLTNLPRDIKTPIESTGLPTGLDADIQRQLAVLSRSGRVVLSRKDFKHHLMLATLDARRHEAIPAKKLALPLWK